MAIWGDTRSDQTYICFINPPILLRKRELFYAQKNTKIYVAYVFLGRDSHPLRHKVVFSCPKLWFWRSKLLQWVLSVTLPGLSASFSRSKMKTYPIFLLCIISIHYVSCVDNETLTREKRGLEALLVGVYRLAGNQF